MAHSRNVQRIAAAKRRAKLYAQRKLAGYTPKPKVVLASHPRLSRKETLHHFNLACGVLPEDSADGPVIAQETPAPFVTHPLEDDVDVLPADFGEMIAQNDVPPTPFIQGSAPNNPSSGGPPVYTPPFTGGVTSPTRGGPGTGTTVSPTNPAPPLTPEVPEPATYVLMLTGMVGAAGAVRNRLKA